MNFHLNTTQIDKAKQTNNTRQIRIKNTVRKDTVSMLTTRLKIMLNILQQLKVRHHQMSVHADVLVLAILSKWILGVVCSKQNQAQLVFVFSKDLKSFKFNTETVKCQQLNEILTY